MSIEIQIYRYNPEIEEYKKPKMVKYVLDLPEDSGIMVLSALEMIKEQDPTLGIRRSCGEGVCGSDGMNINGMNRLSCITRLNQIKKPIKIRPLPGLPVIKDLIVNMNQFYDNFKKVKPYLQTGCTKVPAKEILQSPEDRSKLDGLYECILCACCTTSCPSFWWNPEKFIGPAGLLQAYRFIADSRDGKTQERLQELQDTFSLYRCRGIMNCVNVCPKGLNPTRAIGKIRSLLLKNAT